MCERHTFHLLFVVKMEFAPPYLLPVFRRLASYDERIAALTPVQLSHYYFISKKIDNLCCSKEIDEPMKLSFDEMFYFLRVWFANTTEGEETRCSACLESINAGDESILYK